MSQSSSNGLADLLRDRRDAHLRQLFDLLRIPSVSTDPERAPDVRRAAEWLRDDLAANGFEAELLETPGHPAVFAERRVGEDRPTVLIYGHYDVQPADPLELWDTDPFDPTVRDGAVVARGASDDKGQVFAHVKGAQALLAAEGELPVNVKFLIEGEEEIGSRHLAATIEAESERLAADVVLVSDGTMLPGRVPTLTYGLKGLVYVEARVRTADRDLHSGAYGGGVPGAALALAKILAGLKDDDGRVTVPGFYDAVRELDEGERAQFAKVPFDEAAFASGIGVTSTAGEAGRELRERLWARPTLDVNGIGGGFQGEGSKTVIPAEAFAKISCRIVPDQDPEEITRALTEHIRALAPEGARVEVLAHAGSPWALSDLNGTAVRSAAEAVRAVDGRDPVYVRTGGSIPAVADFQRILGAEVVLVDMGLEDDRIHSPNEKFELDLFYRGIHVSAETLRALGRG